MYNLNMNEFDSKYSELLKIFSKGKSMVLSTSLNNKVSSRTMSVICIDGKFYFQTDKNFRKYNDLINNPNVALCIDNIQIEGKAKCIGKPLDNQLFCDEFEKNFKGSFNVYSSLKDEVLFEVEPLFIERWLYIDDTPYIEIFNTIIKKYELKKYVGE